MSCYASQDISIVEHLLEQSNLLRHSSQKFQRPCPLCTDTHGTNRKNSLAQALWKHHSSLVSSPSIEA